MKLSHIGSSEVLSPKGTAGGQDQLLKRWNAGTSGIADFSLLGVGI
jgi:hypothetical protein|tara:strand:- start:71708 stop:71845 length:138 start_codon:yes stop_codon:yes gene_type:complete